MSKDFDTWWTRTYVLLRAIGYQPSTLQEMDKEEWRDAFAMGQSPEEAIYEHETSE